MDSASSFETNLTLHTRNTFRDVSFSSYLNKAEENMILKLTNQSPDTPVGRKGSEEDEEIGVFGAEKYFKGEIDGKTARTFVDATSVTSKIHQQVVEDEHSEQVFPVKQRTDPTKTRTPSVRSNVSWNSRSGLLPVTNQAPGKTHKGSKTRIFLAGFGCNCIDKKSTEISKKRFIQAKEMSSKSPTRMIDFNQQTEPLSNKWAEKNNRNDYFSFPVLNSNDSGSNSNSKSGNLAGKVRADNNGGRLSLGRKLCLFDDWDVGVPMEDQMYIPSSGMYSHDVDSDTSSDLFEIESFSTTGNSSFLAHRTSESNCYAPSEVSIDWSVVTASAADFSVASDFDEVRTGAGKNSGKKAPVAENKEDQKKRPGLLSGCTNHKAVRVAGDEHKLVGGRRRSSESMVVGNGFRAVNSAGRFDPTRGVYSSEVCPTSKGLHASQMLYIQH